jgi:hypothetical protein
VSLTQTLDEREADKGTLSLEIKAVGKGVLPDLKQLVDLKFTDFEIAGVEDNKLSISKFDESSSVPVVLSEHLWTVSLKDKADNIAAAERSFSFPATLMNRGDVLFQRYDDADLKATEATIVLQRSVEIATFMQRWGTTLLGLVVLVAAAVTGFIVMKSRRVAPVVADSRWSVPDEITPFSVLSLLRDIERNGTLQADDRPALTASITQIERYFFADQPTSATPDLDGTARSWVKKAR